MNELKWGQLKHTPSAGQLVVLKTVLGQREKAKMSGCSGSCSKQSQDYGRRSRVNKIHYYQETIFDQGANHPEDKDCVQVNSESSMPK